jgi:hypothetical protein
MDPSLIKVYRIGDNPEYRAIKSLGFTKSKYCGDSITGLQIALGLGYLEELSLRQHYSFNNQIFLSPFLPSLKSLPEIHEILEKITQEQSTQNEIVLKARTSFSFLQEIIEFSSRFFSIRDEINIVEALNSDSFYNSLKILNTQVAVYSNEGLVVHIQNNRYSHPIQLNLLIQDLETNVMNLYQDNFEIISPEKLNTSETFYPFNTLDSTESLEDLAQVLLNKINASDELTFLNHHLKKTSLFGFSLDSYLT